MSNHGHYSIGLMWSEEDQAYLAQIPELPGCIADGASPEEALRNLQVIKEEWIETATQIGRKVPEPVDIVAAHKIAEEQSRRLSNLVQQEIQKHVQQVAAEIQKKMEQNLGPRQRYVIPTELETA